MNHPADDDIGGPDGAQNTSGLHHDHLGPESAYLKTLMYIVNRIFQSLENSPLDMTLVKFICLRNPNGKKWVRFRMLERIESDAKHKNTNDNQAKFENAVKIFKEIFDEDLVPNPETYWQDLTKKYLSSQLEHTLIHLRLLVNAL